MLKMTETTLKSYKAPGIRLQFVKVNFKDNSPYYQVRKNRCIITTQTDFVEANYKWNNILFNVNNQTKLEL